MQKYLIFLFTIVFFNISFGQDCKYEIDETDEFTGQKILMTNTKVVDLKGKDVYLQLSRTDNKYLLTMKYLEGSTKGNDWFCSQYDPLIIIFKDGSKITLEPNASYRTEFIRMDQMKAGLLGGGLLVELFGNKYVFSPSYNISKSNLEELQTKSIAKFRITATGTSGNTLEKIKDIEFEIGESTVGIVKENSTCIVKGDNSKVELEIPKEFPISDKTNKITFDGVNEFSNFTPSELYTKSKNWAIIYYKSNEFILDEANSKLMRSGSFTKMFEKDNNKNMEANEFFYAITLWFKDGKYKYEFTDLIISDGKEKIALEQLLPMLASRPAKKQEVLSKVYEGITEIVNSLDSSLSGNNSTDDDW